jgi:hypothetical protein
MALLVSDDRAQTWRTVGIGSIGNVFGYYQASLHLKGSRVFLNVAREVPRPFGNVYLGEMWEVDVDTAKTTMLTSAEFISWTPAAVDANGDWMSAYFGPEDLRGGNNCTALLERWSPPATSPTRAQVTFPGICPQTIVPGADSKTAFSVLAENNGLNACVWTLSAAGATPSASGQCVPWAEWPSQNGGAVGASFANEQSMLLQAYSRDGQTYVASPILKKPVALGAGKPGRNMGASLRQRLPGFVIVTKDDGTSQLARVNRDGTADAVNLPSSPCSGAPQSCFDPKNADVAHGVYGDTWWAEPLGNDEFLMVYVHDFAPGINQVKQTITTSIEKATYTPLMVSGPVEEGPPGYPKATKGGPLAAYCARKAACSASAPGTEWMYMCVGQLLTTSAPGLDAALAAAAAAPCTDPIFTQKGYFDCLVNGGTPAVDGNLQLTCTGAPATPPACADPPGTMCKGDKGTVCYQGALSEIRCDLLGMTCDLTATPPAWAPCMSKKEIAYSQTNMPVRCEGKYLLWHINGQQYFDCGAEGYASCSGNRCVF